MCYSHRFRLTSSRASCACVAANRLCARKTNKQTNKKRNVLHLDALYFLQALPKISLNCISHMYRGIKSTVQQHRFRIFKVSVRLIKFTVTVDRTLELLCGEEILRVHDIFITYLHIYYMPSKLGRHLFSHANILTNVMHCA